MPRSIAEDGGPRTDERVAEDEYAANGARAVAAAGLEVVRGGGGGVGCWSMALGG
jgi:hypothetical protein